MIQSTARLVSRLAQPSGLAQPLGHFQRVRGVLSELRPPTPAEIPRAIKDLTRLFRERNWQNVTMRDAWLNTLVTTEVICWFFVGECIGKGTLIGYQPDQSIRHSQYVCRRPISGLRSLRASFRTLCSCSSQLAMPSNCWRYLGLTPQRTMYDD